MPPRRSGPGSLLRPGRVVCLLTFAILAAGCSANRSVATPEVLRVYATSATYPWLDEVYGCASPSLVIEISAPDAAQLKLHFGEPVAPGASAFQVGTDDLLVVVQPQVGVGQLTQEQVRQLFSGQVSRWKDVGGADIPVQVWTYAQGQDIQLVFSRLVMQGQPVASLARLAVSAQAMSDSVGAEPGSIGFLPRRWKMGNTSAVLAMPSLPILAETAPPPEGPLRDLIACMQSKD